MESQKLSERSLWLYNHPKVTELQDSGITDHALIETALAVYIHLIEVGHWFDVQLHSSARLMKILITGRKRKTDSEKEVFLPIGGSSTFIPQSISNLMEESFFKNLSDKNSLNIAAVAGDSNILFYKITDGLVPPDVQS